MEKKSHYTSLVIEYKDSNEMKNHLMHMIELGWTASSVSYGSLRVRYRVNIDVNKL